MKYYWRLEFEDGSILDEWVNNQSEVRVDVNNPGKRAVKISLIPVEKMSPIIWEDIPQGALPVYGLQTDMSFGSGEIVRHYLIGYNINGVRTMRTINSITGKKDFIVDHLGIVK